MTDIRYLSGFSGSNGVLVVGADPCDDLLATDGRYQDQARLEALGLELLIERRTMRAVGDVVSTWRVCATEALSAADAEHLPASLVYVPDLVAELRALKDAHEISLIERACVITAGACAELALEMKPGVSEICLARRLEQLFGEAGAEDRAFRTIVGSGPNSAIPHHGSGPRLLEVGDLVVVDAGAMVEGYCADMTRTYVVAREPTHLQQTLHAAVLAAQSAAREAYQPGADLVALDTIARDTVKEAGYEGRFTHGLGHGLGLDIHEAPMIGPYAHGRLGSSMTVTVEPGIYLPGVGGVRIEDTLLVTDDGPRVLTEAPRELLVVG